MDAKVNGDDAPPTADVSPTAVSVDANSDKQTSSDVEAPSDLSLPDHVDVAKPKKPPMCPARLILFCCNLYIGLFLSQIIPELVTTDFYFKYKQVVKVATYWHLSYIMINVGFEFEIDKSRLRSYGKDYLVAMTAATFPWIFCSCYFMFALGDGHNVPWREALVAGRFAAPTSAGILFTMLEAAGMKQTWLYKKARILAIFDDLDTILLMVPLKGIIVGGRWELSLDLIWVFSLIVIMYKGLHRVNIPATWMWVAFYAASLTAFCECVHLVTHDSRIDQADLVETIHLEILLPAFTIGCIVKHPHAHAGPPATRTLADGTVVPVRQSTLRRLRNVRQDKVKLVVSAIFMVLVGLSMPAIFNEDYSAAAAAHRRLAADDDSASASGSASAAPKMPAGWLVCHVLVCSLLMNVGKMFPACCYRSEINFKTRLALTFGMMPRGEVCAAIIVNAIALGVSGTSITIAVLLSLIHI